MPAKRPPVPLSRERIIEAALHIADTQGLRRLTMRRLGDALQVEAMAIYHHLPRGKEALMDALAEHVTAVHVEQARHLAGHAPGPGAGPAVSCCASTPACWRSRSPNRPRAAPPLAIGEQIEQLADAGLPDAPEAVRALRAFVFGSVAVEVQQSGWADPEVDEWTTARRAGRRRLRARPGRFAEGLQI